MPTHKSLTYVDGHVVHAYEYADAAARVAATGFVAADVGKIARQLDDNSFWALRGYSPIAWFSITGGSVSKIRLEMTAGPVATNLGVYTMVGATFFDKSVYAGASYTLKLLTQSDNANEYSVRVYDVTEGDYLTGTITDDNDDLLQQSLSLTLGTGERVYELHAKLNAGADGVDFVHIPSACIEVAV
jgi:hypothetical protein